MALCRLIIRAKGRDMIRKGDPISFKPEWRDAGDTFQYVATCDQHDDRVDVVALGTDLAFPPINTVKLYMIEGH